jgi:hypothetical protein
MPLFRGHKISCPTPAQIPESYVHVMHFQNFVDLPRPINIIFYPSSLEFRCENSSGYQIPYLGVRKHLKMPSLPKILYEYLANG